MSRFYAQLAALAALALALPATARAQSPYDVTVETAPYFPLTGGTTYTPVSYAFGYPAWHEGAIDVPIGFNFRWFGRTYDTVWVYTNGFLSFDPPPVNALDILRAPTTVPSPQNARHNYIAPMWTDLTEAMSPLVPEIRSVLQGSAPNRVRIIQVSGLRHANGNIAVAFQVRLEEAASSVRIIYHPTDLGGFSATAAIEDATGTMGANLLAMSATCNAQCACAPGTCGSNNFGLNPPMANQGRSIVIRPPLAAELIGAIDGPNGAYPGTNFRATLLVSNIGLGAAGAFGADIRLSTDTTIDSNDTLLRNVAFASLAPSTTSSQSFTLTMPAGLPIARYYLGVIVDPANAVNESVETNNTSRDPSGIVTGPDLVATVAGPLSSGPGEQINVVFGLRSNGAPVTAPITARFYLSTDAMVDPSDTPIHTAPFTLPNGFALDTTIAITIPLNQPPGSYRLLVEVDQPRAIAELDETNNVAIAPGILTLTVPDLEIFDPTSDPVAFRGMPFPATMRVTNRGGGTARNVVVCLVISRNPLISVVSDPVLARTQPMTLASGDSANIRLEPLIDVATATGTWELAGVVDCDEAVQESLETNNVRRRMDPIIIRDPAPDFLTVDLETGSPIAAGEVVPVAVTLGNYGTADGAARVRLVLSDNAGVTAMDQLLYETPMPVAIEAGREEVISFQATLPGDLSSGQYWFGIIVDPDQQLDEVFEDNNIFASVPVTVIGSDLAIISPQLPSAVIGVPYFWRFAAAGGGGAYQWSLTWARGSAPAGLTFDAARAELTGQPQAAAEGTHNVTVRVASGALSAEQTYTLRITPPSLPLSIVSGKLPPALQGERYSVTLVAVGGTPPYEWSLESGRLPLGLTISSSGEISGEAEMTVASTFQVRVEDAAGAVDISDVALDVIDPSASLTITTPDVPSGMVGEPFSKQFEVGGGTAPYRWRIDGALVPGLAFGPDDGLLAGTPTVAGTYPLVIEVRDARGLLDRNAYVLRVHELGNLAIVTGRTEDDQLPRGVVGQPYVTENGPVRLRAVKQGGDLAGVRWMIVLGSLPDGLLLDTESGEIRGAPTAAGVSAFTVLVHDASGDRDRVTLAIAVDPADTDTTPVDEGCGCTTTPSQRGGLWGLALLAIGLIVFRARKLVFLALFFPAIAQAQPIPYTFTTESMPFQPLANAVRVTPDLGDGGVVAIPLPFDVYLYGTSSRTLWVNANGLVAITALGTGKHFPDRSNPDPSPPNGYIAALWSDWCSGNNLVCGFPDPAPGAGIYYAIDSTPGDGRVTVEYRNIRHFFDDLTASNVSFQITIHEGQASRISLHYGNITPGVDFSGAPTDLGSAIGIESADGRNGQWIDPCGNGFCDGAQVVALSNTRISMIADAGRDVSLAGLTVPNVGFPGLDLPIEVRVFSRHAQPIGPFVVAAYLVGPTATSTIGGARIATSDPISLPAFGSQLVSLSGAIAANTNPSRYRVAVVADADRSVAETFEDNNTVFSGAVRIAGRAADFQLLSARVLDRNVSPGGTMRLAYRVRNSGNEPGSAEMRGYLSANSALTAADRSFGAPITLQLQPGQIATGTISAALSDPHPTGVFYAGAIVDPASTVVELDETNNVAVAVETVSVTGAGLVILTDALPPATLTQAYSTQIEVGGGDQPASMRVSRGALPRGMAFTDGELFGVPLEAGEFPIELEATSGTLTARKDFVLTVIDPNVPLTIVTRNLPIAIVGSDYAAPIHFTGGEGPFGWRLIGRLPIGLNLAVDGTILGNPREAGPSTFGIELRDNAGATATAALSLDVVEPGNLLIATESLPDATLGQPYDVTLVAFGGVGQVRWTAESNLPAGLSLLENGALTGIPEEAGEFGFEVQVQDDALTIDNNRLIMTIRPTGRLRIVTDALPEATVGTAFRAVIRADGGRRPYDWTFDRTEGALPEGFVAGKSDGTLEGETDQDLIVSGTLSREGVWPFTLRVRDAQGQTVERPFALVGRVPPPPPVVEEEGCGCSTTNDRSRSSLFAGLLIGLVLLLRRRPTE